MRPIPLHSILLLLSLALASPAASGQCEVQRLSPSDLQIGGFFGRDVAFDGPDRLLVGASHADGQANESGQVYLYERMGGSWLSTGELAPVDGHYRQEFYRLAIDGDHLLVGAPGDDQGQPGQLRYGAVYAFSRVGGQWVQQQKLLDPTPMQNTSLGLGLAVRGDRALIGGPGEFIHPPTPGEVHAFEFDGSQWNHVQSIASPNLGISDRFGLTIVFDGDDRALVSASHFDVGSTERVGRVHVLRHDGSGWVFDQTIDSSDPRWNDYFGLSLAVAGDTLLVGKSGDRGGAGRLSGSVLQYRRTGSGWVEQAEIKPPDASSFYWFGTDLAFDGERALITATYSLNDGKAYFYRLVGDDLKLVGRRRGGTYATRLTYGRAAALEGEHFVVGAPVSTSYAEVGHVYVYDWPQDTWPYALCGPGNWSRDPAGFTALSPCDNPDSFAGCAHTFIAQENDGGRLCAAGTTSVTSDDLLLVGEQLVPSETVQLWVGPNAALGVFGDGLRAVGGGSIGVTRFPPTTCDTDGRVVQGPGLVMDAASLGTAILPGSTWYFQMKYDSPFGPCGTGFSLTNGVRVMFRP